MASYFLIGGSKHGTLARLLDYQTEYFVATSAPLCRLDHEMHGFQVPIDFPKERYVMHSFGVEVDGVKTQRRARYLVSDRLSIEESERQIDAFENQQESMVGDETIDSAPRRRTVAPRG